MLGCGETREARTAASPDDEWIFPAEPRCALLPLGSVRGVEGLTVWEYIAFASKCRNRYRSGDKEREEEEEMKFDWEEEWHKDDENSLMTREEELEEEAWNAWVEEQEALDQYYDSLEAIESS